MKIDIHTHTKKIKSGDAETRNIDAERFSEIIKGTDIKILAITNHNHFDKLQYEAFRAADTNGCQIWPGIELDIFENEKRAHLIVIVNPKNYAEFSDRVNSLSITDPDTFSISIKDTVETFDDLDCIYIAHYFTKKPNLGDEEIEILNDLALDSRRVIKEATNSISAGIYISHGHNSIYGSDVQDWDDYIDISKKLPELRLPVESFEQFCLLLEKDEPTINTLLNKKVKESIEIAPFGIAELIRLEIYNDINILFGSKGTGKTEILDALSKYFNSKGHKTNVYKSNDQHLNDVFDIKGNDFDLNVKEIGLDDCEEDIKFIKEVTEEEVTSLSKYIRHFSSKETNKISQKLKIKEIARRDDTQILRTLDEVSGLLSKFTEFRAFIDQNESTKEFIDDNLTDKLDSLLDDIIVQLKSETENNLLDSKSIKLLNGIVELFQEEVAKKTGLPKKPSRTGFAKYASNRIKIELAATKIINTINKQIEPIEKYVGSLGDKGELYCHTNLYIHDGNISDGNYSPVKDLYKTPQKEFSEKLRSIHKHIYSNDLFKKISELNDINGIDSINNMNDLLLFYRHFVLDNELYKPSDGESSMLLLHNELKEDKDIYLIDEPEKSLGNDYINDVIVPILKEKANLGKKVIIATHDANIAVRTLPYNSIYRLHDNNQYYTMTGNPFSNKLKCINGDRDDLDWKKVSMKTLEGGKDAFGERGKIYGSK